MSNIVPEYHDDDNELNSPHRDDPYHLQKYKSDYVPADGGAAPLPKTVEPEKYHDNRLYVSNIPFSFTEGHLTDLFSRFGNVIAAMIVTNERGSKGFGFVTMDSVESCEKARRALQGEKIFGRIIEVRKATPLARGPPPKRGSNSASSSTVPSPHRAKPQTKRPPRITRTPTTTIAINPHVIRTAHAMGQPAAVQAPFHTSPPPAVPIANLIQHTTALSVLLSENPVLLHNLLAPLQIATQLASVPYQSAMPQAYFAPTPFYPAPLPPATLVSCGMPPPPPPQQSQRGFSYRVAPAPSRQYVTVSDTGVAYFDQSQQYSRGSSSLNNSNLNGTILSSSMNAHMEGMQDQLVDLLGLDATMNRSRLLELKGSKDCSFNGSSSSTDSDSSRKRRSLAIVEEEGSPRKISKINQYN